MRYSVLLTILAILLNGGLLLLPSILLGVPNLILDDRRLATFLLIASLWIVAEARLNSKRIPTQSSSTSWLAILMSAAMLFVFLASLTEQALRGAVSFNVFTMFGCLATLGGVLLRYLAIRALGAYFLDEVIIISGQPLVTTGIYKYLRHPSESGNLSITFGSSLLLGSLAGLVICTVVVLPIVLVRIRLEDKLLMRYYPESFASYKRDVPALFPLFPIRHG